MEIKQSKKDSNSPITKLSLAFVDDPIEVSANETGGDPYESKLGGEPIWLNSSVPFETITCSLCSKPQVFLMQLFVPLPPKNLDRILYIFCCKSSNCTKKSEGFTVIRVHNKFQRQQLQDSSKVQKVKEEPKTLFAPTNTASNQSSFMLGNIWGSSNSNHGAFASPTNNSPFSAPSGFFGANAQQEQKNEDDDLMDKLDQLKINDKEELNNGKDNNIKEEVGEELTVASWPHNLPYYSPYYLAFDEEINESESPIDLSKYKKYEAMVKEQIQQNTNEEGGMNWEGEGYEKTPLPHGMDKEFEHFGNIIQYYPDQCLRYQFNGNPLLYHNQDEISQKILKGSSKKQTRVSFDRIEACKRCGGPRTFECQLMPQLLSYLTLNNNSQTEECTTNELNLQLKGQNFLDQFDLGMEFGTVLIFSCKNDCNLKSNSFFERELAFPQHQL